MSHFTEIRITATRSRVDVSRMDREGTEHEAGATATVGEVTGDGRFLMSLWERDEEGDLSAFSNRLAGTFLISGPLRRVTPGALARAAFRVSGLAVISGRPLLEGSITIPGPGESQIWHGTPVWGVVACEIRDRMEVPR